MATYDQDFFQWTQETARAIQEGRFDQIDKVALAGEVESLGKRDRRESASRMTVILVHMLKANYQPDRDGASWRATLQTQRRELADFFEDSPSLRSQAPELLPRAYRNARLDAASETGLAIAMFPETCQWTVEQVLG